jgi:hypothetical protein
VWAHRIFLVRSRRAASHASATLFLRRSSLPLSATVREDTDCGQHPPWSRCAWGVGFDPPPAAAEALPRWDSSSPPGTLAGSRSPAAARRRRMLRRRRHQGTYPWNKHMKQRPSRCVLA